MAAVAALVFACGHAARSSCSLTAVVFGAGLGVATTSIYAAATHAVPASSRGVAFAYLTRAYLVGSRGESGRRRPRRAPEHARRSFSAMRSDSALLAWVVRRMTLQGRMTMP